MSESRKNSGKGDGEEGPIPDPETKPEHEEEKDKRHSTETQKRVSNESKKRQSNESKQQRQSYETKQRQSLPSETYPSTRTYYGTKTTPTYSSPYSRGSSSYSSYYGSSYSYPYSYGYSSSASDSYSSSSSSEEDEPVKPKPKVAPEAWKPPKPKCTPFLPIFTGHPNPLMNKMGILPSRASAFIAPYVDLSFMMNCDPANYTCCGKNNKVPGRGGGCNNNGGGCGGGYYGGAGYGNYSTGFTGGYPSQPNGGAFNNAYIGGTTTKTKAKKSHSGSGSSSNSSNSGQAPKNNPMASAGDTSQVYPNPNPGPMPTGCGGVYRTTCADCPTDEEVEEGGVDLKFGARTDCATEVVVTLEPKKQPYWKTLLNCGFKPMITCPAPPWYLNATEQEVRQPPQCPYYPNRFMQAHLPQCLPPQKPQKPTSSGSSCSSSSSSSSSTSDPSSSSYSYMKAVSGGYGDQGRSSPKYEYYSSKGSTKKQESDESVPLFQSPASSEVNQQTETNTNAELNEEK